MILGIIGLINLKEIVYTKENHRGKINNLLKPYKIMGIYGIYLGDELIYIGQSKNIAKRFLQHRYCILNKNKEFNKYSNINLPMYNILYNAYLAGEQIRFGVLKVINDKNLLFNEETKYIKKFYPTYNIHA